MKNKLMLCSLRNLNLFAGVMLALILPAQAAQTDIARAPLTGGASGQVKPNIMLLMDTSKSMSFTHMPDELETGSGVSSIGYKSFQCNSLYYNPDGSYPVPKAADGSPLALPSFSSAPYSGYDSILGTVNLTTGFQAYNGVRGPKSTIENVNDVPFDTSDTPKAAYYYIYTGTQLLPNGRLNFRTAPCTDVDTSAASSSATGGGTWKRVVVSTTSGTGATNELQKFATWYTYYRSRINLTKSSLSLAFTPITDAYRVGLITTLPSLPGTPVNASKYLPINDFGAVQRTAWFSKLFAQQPFASSPTREALARVGRHYAGKTDGINDGMPEDPVQYSCQQNFTILTTDGVWGVGAETPGKGPVKIDGTTLVGQQDGALAKLSDGGQTKTAANDYLPCVAGGENCAPPPIWDGGGDSTKTITDKSNEYQQKACSSPYFLWTKSQVKKKTEQQLKQTTQYSTIDKQTTQTDFTQLRSTSQLLRTSVQQRQTTLQLQSTKTNNIADTRRYSESRVRFTKNTATSFTTGTRKIEQTVTQYLANTKQQFADTNVLQETVIQQSLEKREWRKTILQYEQKQTNTTMTRLQLTRKDTKTTADTFQTKRSRQQYTQAQSVIIARNSLTEERTRVASCPTGANFTCQTFTTGYGLVSGSVASCAASGPTAGNGNTTTTCANISPPDDYMQSGTCVSGVIADTGTITTYNGGPPANGFVTSTGQSTATCTTTAPGPQLVASCTPQNESAFNQWKQINCATTTITPVNNYVASCTGQTAALSNGYVQIDCTKVVDDVAVPVATPCNNVMPTMGNNYLSVACSVPSTVTTYLPADTCVPGTNQGANFTTTVCNTLYPAPATNDVGVATCSPGSTGGTTNIITQCVDKSVQTKINVSSCSAGTTLMGTIRNICTYDQNISNSPINVCVSDPVGTSPYWIRRTCATTATKPAVAVASCTVNSVDTAANGYVRQVACSTTTLLNSPQPAPCTGAVAASSGNNFTQTTSCGSPNPKITTTGVATCAVGSPPASASLWQFVTNCPVTPITGPTVVASCPTIPASAGTMYIETYCTPNGGGSSTVNTCTPSGAGIIPVVTCTPITTGTNLGASIGVASCVPGAVRVVTGGTGFTATCNAIDNKFNVPINDTCVTTAPASISPLGIVPDWTAIVNCKPTTPVVSSSYVASCVNGIGTYKNPASPFDIINCVPTAISANNVPVASCTPDSPTVLNNQTTITCPTDTQTDIPAASCALGDNNSLYITTSCRTNIVTNEAVPPGSCTVGAQVSGEPFRIITQCNTTAPAPYYSSTCVANDGTSSPFLRTSCNEVTSPAKFVAVCTPGPSDSGSPYFIRTTCTKNQSAAIAVQDGTCTNDPATMSNNYLQTVCSRNDSGPAFVLESNCTASVAASASNAWTNTICTPITSSTGSTPSATCVGAGGMSEAPTSTNDYLTVTCTPAPGKQQQYRTTTTTDVQLYSNGTRLLPYSVPVTSAPTGWTDMNMGVCYANNAAAGDPQLPALPAGGVAGRPGEDGRPLVPAPANTCVDPTKWPCQVNTGGFGGKANTLADVAQYYYTTDLRPLMIDNVPATGTSSEGDNATWQHMTTFTIGLGVTGVTTYDPTYKNLPGTGDFAAIRTLAKSWPLPPDAGDAPDSEKPNTIDDIWHTAVNGRGQYFSADNPQAVISGLSSALFSALDRAGAGAAAGASASRLIEGASNFAYFSNYITQKWTGDLEARELDTMTGIPSATVAWRAGVLLNAKAKAQCDTRKIYLIRTDGTAPANNLVNFSFNSRNCDASGSPTGLADTGLNAAEQSYFDSSKVLSFSQYIAMTDGTGGTVDQRTPAAGANLVNFIRGQSNNEGFVSNLAGKLYRARTGILGAAINAQPVYLKAIEADYQDAGYSAFKAANQTRTPIIYVPANDGMLHAFYAGTSATDPLAGQEAWALIPTTVLPNLYKLADANFGSNFQYTVDGSPTVGDAFDTGSMSWKSVLIGGLNSGGRGYYALDVTTPTAPKALWEFKWSDTCYDGTAANGGADCHLGLTFGVPVLTKLANGKWVVMITSGYNNVNAPAKIGDGQGYLYVLDAFTGKIIYKISTGAGSATTPSGLSRISNFVDNTKANNTTLRVYGGDLLGNVWRFDVNDTIPPANVGATRVGIAKDSSGNLQPITTRPELGEVNGKTIVLVGTGRLIGTTDLTDTSKQTVYGIVDAIPTDGSELYGDLRASLHPVTIASAGAGVTAYRTISCTASAAVCAGTTGWYADLPDAGERVNIDLKLQLGTLVFASNVPQGTACNIGGYSWLNSVNFATGLAVAASANNSISQRIVPTDASGAQDLTKSGLTTGFNFFQLPDGTVRGFVTDALGNRIAVVPPISIAPPVGKRISWQEIMQ